MKNANVKGSAVPVKGSAAKMTAAERKLLAVRREAAIRAWVTIRKNRKMGFATTADREKGKKTSSRQGGK